MKYNITLDKQFNQEHPELVFIAHPIGGNVQQNIESVLGICRQIHTTCKDTVPFAPYIPALQYLNDDISEERKLGMTANEYFFKNNIIDALWLCGPKISSGMKKEVLLAYECGIKVKCYNPMLKSELDEIIKENNLV